MHKRYKMKEWSTRHGDGSSSLYLWYRVEEKCIIKIGEESFELEPGVWAFESNYAPATNFRSLRGPLPQPKGKWGGFPVQDDLDMKFRNAFHNLLGELNLTHRVWTFGSTGEVATATFNKTGQVFHLEGYGWKESGDLYEDGMGNVMYHPSGRPWYDGYQYKGAVLVLSIFEALERVAFEG